MENKKIKILLADDHHVFREGIQALLFSEKNMEVVGEAANGKELIKKLNVLKTDVLLLDIDMPEINGLEMITYLAEKFPQIHVLVFSMHDSEQYVRHMLAKGAKGYILKSCRKGELIRAVNTVGTGDSYLSKEVAKFIFDKIENKQSRTLKNLDMPLTNREVEVLKLVATGRNNLEIGELLHISHRTVDTHRRNMMEKLGIHNAAALINYASQKGLLGTVK